MSFVSFYLPAGRQGCISFYAAQCLKATSLPALLAG